MTVNPELLGKGLQALDDVEAGRAVLHHLDVTGLSPLPERLAAGVPEDSERVWLAAEDRLDLDDVGDARRADRDSHVSSRLLFALVRATTVSLGQLQTGVRVQ